MKNRNYINYFESHYKLKFDSTYIRNYKNWFYAQWEVVRRYIKINSETEVLELGSGIGTVYEYLTEEGVKRYTGLELDLKAAKFCNEHYTTRNFLNESFEDYKPKRFLNYIMAFEVLEHLDDPNGVVKKMFSRLKKGGKFIGTSPYPFYKNVVADNTHKYVLHPESWERMFLASGFKKVYTYPMSFLPFLWRVNKYLNVVIPCYLHFPYFISTTLIVAEK